MSALSLAEAVSPLPVVACGGASAGGSEGRQGLCLRSSGISYPLEQHVLEGSVDLIYTLPGRELPVGVDFLVQSSRFSPGHGVAHC